MSKKIRNRMFFSILLLVVNACATKNLTYSLDPEIGDLQSLSKIAQLIAVLVVDNRTVTPPSIAEDSRLVNGAKDEANELRRKLIDRLKNKNFKIINNPLLADLALEIQIEQLHAVVKESFLKSEIQVATQLRFKATKQGKSFEKIYTMSGSQEVANPLKNTDISGVVNRILTDQLFLIFNEQGLVKLVAE